MQNKATTFVTFVECERAGGGNFYPILKRCFDLAGSLFGLLLLGPLGLVLAGLIKLSDGGPVFYRQWRVGWHGKPFLMLKFRSMMVGAEKLGPPVTKDRDPRITHLGRILRKTKLDELPQLWNVLTGTMSFVGPRPEVPRYVDCYSPEQQEILHFKPGITDLATLLFREEEALLRTAVNVEEFYVRHCVPRKLKLNLEYAERANLFEDTLIILQTLCPYRLTVSCGYGIALAASLWVAYALRFDFNLPALEWHNLLTSGCLIIPLQMLVLFWRRHFTGLLSYFDLPEMKQLAFGLGLAAVLQWILWSVTKGALVPARSIIFAHFLVSLLLLATVRALLRSLRESRPVSAKRTMDHGRPLRVGLVGAGELGAWLVNELNHKNRGNHHIEAIFDDDPGKWHKRLHGILVVGMPECILDGSWVRKLDEVIVAMNNTSPERTQQVVSILGKANIRVRTVPSLDEILSK